MIKFPMPLSMGANISTDFSTFQTTIEHPFLEVGSSYCCLKEEIRDWVTKTYGKCVFEFDGNDYCLWFDNESDITLFLLRWS